MAVTPIWPIEGVALESAGAGTAVANSLAYRVLRMYDDVYMPVSVHPSGEAGVAIESHINSWALGAITEIVAANHIATTYLLKAVVIETLTRAPDPNGVYELVLYQGGADAEVARVRFSVWGGFFGGMILQTPSVLIPANARIRGQLMYSLAGGTAVAAATISLIFRPIA